MSTEEAEIGETPRGTLERGRGWDRRDPQALCQERGRGWDIVDPQGTLGRLAVIFPGPRRCGPDEDSPQDKEPDGRTDHGRGLL